MDNFSVIEWCRVIFSTRHAVDISFKHYLVGTSREKMPMRAIILLGQMSCAHVVYNTSSMFDQATVKSKQLNESKQIKVNRNGTTEM